MTTREPTPVTASAPAAILDATERLLQTRGFSELAVSDIIAAAGVSRTSFYAHFGSRAAVLAACLRRIVGELTATDDDPRDPDDAGAPDLDPAIAVGDDLRRWVALAVAHGPLLRTVSEQWPHDPELRDEWMGAMETMSARLTGRIERARARGDASPGADPAALAAMLTWGCERVLHVALVGQAAGLEDLEATVEPLTQLVLGGAFRRTG